VFLCPPCHEAITFPSMLIPTAQWQGNSCSPSWFLRLQSLASWKVNSSFFAFPTLQLPDSPFPLAPRPTSNQPYSAHASPFGHVHWLSHQKAVLRIYYFIVPPPIQLALFFFFLNILPSLDPRIFLRFESSRHCVSLFATGPDEKQFRDLGSNLRSSLLIFPYPLFQLFILF